MGAYLVFCHSSSPGLAIGTSICSSLAGLGSAVRFGDKATADKNFLCLAFLLCIHSISLKSLLRGSSQVSLGP